MSWLVAAFAALHCVVAVADGPTVWLVEGGASRVYVTGSIHLLKAGQFEPSAALERAYHDASRLVMEVDPADLAPDRAAAATAALALDPAGRDLDTLLGTDAAALHAAATAAGVDLAAYRRFEPWFVAIAITAAGLERRGLSAESGVEQALARRAAADGKPVAGLETVSGQLASLDRLPTPLQARLLRMSLAELAEPDEPLDSIVQAWRAGDDAALAAALSAEFKDFPELYQGLIVERNRRFAVGIAALAAAQDDVLVVVGALHLVGRQSVLEMLARQGLKPRRLAAN